MVVAHRGSSAVVAEHTLAAYERAIVDGADGVECDVRLTRDGHLVCVHDRRLDRTSDGYGLVSERSLDDLDRLDFGRWHDDLPRVADELIDPLYRMPEVASVLTLDELLGLVVDTDRLVRIFIETKHPNRYAGLVEQELVSALRRFGLADPPDPHQSAATLMSFAPIAVRRMRLLAPAVPKVWLMTSVPPRRRDGSLPAGVELAGPSVRMLRDTPDYVRRVHSRGHRVYAWTVDADADVDLVAALGVDVIATNEPIRVRARLAAP